MTDSQILQLFGIMYFTVGMGIVLNPKFCRKLFDKYTHDLPSLYLNGFLLLALGFTLVTLNPEPSGIREIVLAILGWIAFLKGVFILIAPESFISISKRFLRKHDYYVVEALFVVFLGLILMVIGII